MTLGPEDLKTLTLLDAKERMLNEIVVWLRAKGLWEECRKDLLTKIGKEEEEDEAKIFNGGR